MSVVSLCVCELWIRLTLCRSTILLLDNVVFKTRDNKKGNFCVRLSRRSDRQTSVSLSFSVVVACSHFNPLSLSTNAPLSSSFFSYFGRLDVVVVNGPSGFGAVVTITIVCTCVERGREKRTLKPAAPN